MDAHALIVSASSTYHNYRHLSNALLVRDAMVQTSGTSAVDANIVLMLAGSTPCDPRNALAGSVFATSPTHSAYNMYPRALQVDYRGDAVTVDAVLGVLTDRPHSSSPSRAHPVPLPAQKRLRSGPGSRLIVYLTGHGGDEFLKFSDQFELNAAELALAIRHTFALGRCKELLLLVDTCQASTLINQLPLLPPLLGDESAHLPDVRVISLASSGLGENSFSYDTDRETLGVALSDRFTFHVHSFVSRAPAKSATIAGLETFLKRAHLISRPVRTDVGWSGDGHATESHTYSSASADSLPLRRFFSSPDAPMHTASFPPQPCHQLSSSAAHVQLARTAFAPAAVPAARWRRHETEALWGGLPPSSERVGLLPPEAVPEAGVLASADEDLIFGPGLGAMVCFLLAILTLAQPNSRRASRRVAK